MTNRFLMLRSMRTLCTPCFIAWSASAAWLPHANLHEQDASNRSSPW